MEAPGTVQLVEWGVAYSAHPGERESGDQFVVEPYAGGVVLAAIDGLGHGAEAALAGRMAAEVIRAHAGQPLDAMVRACHAALLGTRGVAVTLAAFDPDNDTMSWIGVGNVEAILQQSDVLGRGRRERVVSRGGVVGYQLPPLRASSIPVRAGDVLVLATDGVREEFAQRVSFSGGVQLLADKVLSDYARMDDDALVVVARYLGREP